MDGEWGVHMEPDALPGPQGHWYWYFPQTPSSRGVERGHCAYRGTSTRTGSEAWVASRQTGMTRARNIPLHTASAVRITIPLADIVEHGWHR